MNISSIREYPKRFAAVGIIDSKELIRLEKALLFVMHPRKEEYTEEEAAFIREHCFKDGVPFTPFNELVLVCQNGKESLRLWWLRTTDGWSIIAACDRGTTQRVAANFDLSFSRYDLDALYGSIHLSKLWIDGQHSDHDQIKRVEALPDCRGFRDGVTNQLTLFCFQLLCGSTVLRVSPNKQGKSVHWTFQRSHYLVLPAHQANALAVSKSAVTEQEITRAAHARRAHLRRLMSDRFTKKKGSIVQIKHCWVGPKEWTGTDNKIYKVTESYGL